MEAKQIVLHLENAIKIVNDFDEMLLVEITREHVNQFFDDLRKEVKSCIKLNPFIFQSNDDGDDFYLLLSITQMSTIDGAFGAHAKKRLKAFLANIAFQLKCTLVSMYPLK